MKRLLVLPAMAIASLSIASTAPVEAQTTPPATDQSATEDAEDAVEEAIPGDADNDDSDSDKTGLWGLLGLLGLAGLAGLKRRTAPTTTSSRSVNADTTLRGSTTH